MKSKETFPGSLYAALKHLQVLNWLVLSAFTQIQTFVDSELQKASVEGASLAGLLEVKALIYLLSEAGLIGSSSC